MDFKCRLMLSTHESKTTGHKFNGRKGVGDEVLELPIGIMQDNTQVSWLATRGLSPLPQGPWEQTQQHALYWGPNAQGLWEQTNQHPLVPRLCWGPNPQGLWEQTRQHPLVPRLCWGPNPQGLWEQTPECALVPRLCWGPNPQGLWEQTRQHPLVPRLCWGPNPQGLWEQNQNVPWFPGYAGLWEQSQQQLQHWGSHSPRKADHVSLWGKRATCTEHFIPSRCLFSSGK